MTDHEYDQQLAEAREKLPALWWALYTGAIEKGFTPEQAMELVKEYIKVIG